MNPLNLSRRLFLGASAAGLAGRSALAEMADLPHHKPTAKRIIYLFQSGGPSQLESFDYKPKLKDVFKQDLPESVRQGQRLTTMSASQSSFPMVPSKFSFAQHGNSGAWVSELFPHTAKIVDDLTFIKSMHTDQINHDPAVTFFQTGFQIAGRPSIGAWIAYGLGSENQNLPGFIVLISPGQGGSGQPLYDRLWGAGFLPSKYQGVKFRSIGDPVLYLKDPDGITRDDRRAYLDTLGALNQVQYEQNGDPETQARIAQYEMAFRMQSSVPELTDISKEPESTFKLYGEDARKPGTFAANCLLARRLAERGVRFIQLFHRDWDHHGGLPKGMPARAKETDQAGAALVADLKQRGLLDDTLVVWGGEFGRTVYCQGRLTEDDYGRDHHPRCFTIWMAGGGMKPGMSLGSTDDFSYNITENPVDVHDLHATLLHTLGIDHTKLTYKFQGRHFRLTDVHGKVVKAVLA
ncbi:MAG: DUF1501 domain-containing protein [Acidobacteria bacterium]|nr:DUF1501 domain-containing protein [Acidobacteriota bacterium]